MADLLALARVNHHLMSKNDKKPTPSHPMNRSSKFLVDVSIIMLRRNIIRSRKKFLFEGSLLM